MAKKKDGNKYDKVFENASKDVINRIASQHTPKKIQKGKKK